MTTQKQNYYYDMLHSEYQAERYWVNTLSLVSISGEPLVT